MSVIITIQGCESQDPDVLKSLLDTFSSLLIMTRSPVVVYALVSKVRTLFDSTQSQESKSEVGLRNGTRQCALGPILRHALYLLWCLGSNLDV